MVHWVKLDAIACLLDMWGEKNKQKEGGELFEVQMRNMGRQESWLFCYAAFIVRFRIPSSHGCAVEYP